MANGAVPAHALPQEVLSFVKNRTDTITGLSPDQLAARLALLGPHCAPLAALLAEHGARDGGPRDGGREGGMHGSRDRYRGRTGEAAGCGGLAGGMAGSAGGGDVKLRAGAAGGTGVVAPATGQEAAQGGGEQAAAVDCGVGQLGGPVGSGELALGGVGEGAARLRAGRGAGRQQGGAEGGGGGGSGVGVGAAAGGGRVGPPSELQLFLRAVQLYDRDLAAANSIDFDDLIGLAVALMKQSAAARSAAAAQYK